MLKFSTILLFISILFNSHFNKTVNFTSTILSDTIRKEVFIDIEEKKIDSSFVINDTIFTVETKTIKLKNDFIYYSDTIENQITTFKANNILYQFSIAKGKEKIINFEINKKNALSKRYDIDYEFLSNTNPLVLMRFRESEKFIIISSTIGIKTWSCILEQNSELKAMLEGKFETCTENLISTKKEIYNFKTNQKLNFTAYFQQHFHGEFYIQDIETHYQFVSDSVMMLAYFYNYYDDKGIKSNLLILNSNYKILKRTSLLKCPDGSFDFESKGSFLLIFNPKLERVKLYSVKENKFYSLLVDSFIRTESGVVFEENKAQNDKNLKLIAEKRSKFTKVIKFQSHCPKNTSFTFQIDTVQKKIMSCQIDEFRR